MGVAVKVRQGERPAGSPDEQAGAIEVVVHGEDVAFVRDAVGIAIERLPCRHLAGVVEPVVVAIGRWEEGV